MMRALVVFESMFGNTQVIARSVAAGLAPRLRVTFDTRIPNRSPGYLDVLEATDRATSAGVSA